MLTNNNAIDAKTTAIAGPVGAKPISRVLVLVAAAGVAAGLLIAGLGIALPIGLTANQRSRSVFALSAGSSNGGVHLAGTTRHYYLAAEPLEWDYAPAGLNLCSNSSFKDTPAELYTTAGAGTRFRKAVFRQYADAQFKVPALAGGRDAHSLQRAHARYGLQSMHALQAVSCNPTVQAGLTRSS